MDQFTTEPVAVARTGTGTMARIGLLGVAAAALVAVAFLATGAMTAPAGLLAADDTSTDSSLSESEPFMDGGPGMGPGHGFGGITITAIRDSNISLATVDGWTRTITVDADTTYTKGTDTIALSDLAVGDEIRFRQTLEDDGSWTIDSVAVILPHVGGQVTAIDGSTITVEQADGTAAMVKVNGDTSYTVNGTDAALSDVSVDMYLMAVGTKNADGSLTATAVRAGRHAGRGFGPDFDGRGQGPRRFGPGGDWFGNGTGDTTGG
jgi:Domain of unknown function (DUF5666)